MSLLARQSDGRRLDGCRAVCSRQLTAECQSRPTSKRVPLSVAPYDADRLSSVIRVPVRYSEPFTTCELSGDRAIND
eukprot:4792276-Prymnesium_polylepis.1